MKVHVKILLSLFFAFLNILNADKIEQGILELKNNNEFEAERFFRAASKANKLKPAISTWEKECKNGNFENCFYLGFVYLNGLGVTLDKKIGHDFFKKACENNVLQSCVSAGFYFPRDNTEEFCNRKGVMANFMQKIY